MQSVFWKDNNNTDYYFRILDSRNGVLDSRHLEDKEIDIVDPTAGSNQSDSEVLKNTFMIYGTILVVSFLLFCFVRQRFPRPYSIRNWVQKVKV